MEALKEIKTYLEIASNIEVRKLKNVFNFFYKEVEFLESEIPEYKFHENNYKYLTLLVECGVINYELKDDDIFYETKVSQIEMTKINNLIDDHLNDSGMNYIEI